MRSNGDGPECATRGTDPCIEIVVIVQHHRATARAVVGWIGMFPNGCLNFVERRRKSGLDFLILSQALDDLQYGISLRYVCPGSPLGSVGLIGHSATIVPYRKRNQPIRKTETALTCFSFQRRHPS